MTSDPELLKHFATNWMAWLTLRHFLPTDLLQALIDVVAQEHSDGSVKVSTLFDDLKTSTPTWNDSWLLMPRRSEAAHGSFLRQLISAIVWQGDGESTIWAGPKENEQATARVQAIVSLSSADFLSLDSSLANLASRGPFQTSFDVLRAELGNAATSFARGGNADWTALEKAFHLDVPIKLCLIKHLADLFADADGWSEAAAGYERAQELLDAWHPSATWHRAKQIWTHVIVQSRASALRVVSDSRAAHQILQPAVAKARLSKAPELFANASLDLFVLSTHPDLDGIATEDIRALVLHNPLLIESHNDLYARRYSARGKFRDAHRRYWASLRRQTALGSRIESNHTRTSYARSILDELRENLKGNRSPVSFRLAILLLVQGEDAEAASLVSWNEALVDAYVDNGAADYAIATARAHAGVRRERELVVIQLFVSWSHLIDPSKEDLVLRLWRHVATLAAEFIPTFESVTDVGRRALRALREFEKVHPKATPLVAEQVALAIHARLGLDEPWFGKSEALETAVSYAGAFPLSDAAAVLEATLNLLERTAPASGDYPLIRPAMRFLVCEEMKEARTQGQLRRRSATQILRFGLEQESEQSRVFFYLRDFDPELLQDASIIEQLSVPLSETRKRARQINSSSVTEHICALLQAPSIARGPGIQDAAEGLADILRSAAKEHVSLGLPFGYDAVLLLSDNTTDLRANLADDELVWFAEIIHTLASLIADLWEHARSRPNVFATFSLPPKTRPDDVIVHNWAFASLRFAEQFGAVEPISIALDRALSAPELASPIALARATRALAQSVEGLSISAILHEDREVFYATLGRRLTTLSKLESRDAVALVRVLLRQCFRLGPNELDLAVLVAARQTIDATEAMPEGFEAYSRRVNNNRSLRLAIAPMLDEFESRQSRLTK